MKSLILLLAILMLAGCARLNTEANVALDKGIRYGAAAADTELKTAEWGTCYVPTVGALRRRYAGGDQNRIVGWQLYCAEVWKSNGEVSMELFDSNMPASHPCESPISVEACEAWKTANGIQ